MKKNKTARTLDQVGSTQQMVEKSNADKFQDTRPVNKQMNLGRKCPQVSYTVTATDKELIEECALMLSNKHRRIIKPSEIMRAVIRLAKVHIDELDIE